jgi:hypothetical protein
MPFFHHHTWVEEQRSLGKAKWAFTDELDVTVFLLRCEKCGELKEKIIKGYFPKSE